jgi:putative ABC transport system permease protein
MVALGVIKEDAQMVVRIAFRNIFRQKRRTVLTVLTMFGGYTLASIGISWSDGTYANITDIITRYRFGHIQLHKEGYRDSPSLYNVIHNVEQVGAAAQAIEGVQAWAPRIYASGLASVGEKSAGVRIIGVDPGREMSATRLESKIVRGAYFSGPHARQAIIGGGLAKILGASPADEVVVVSQAADGSIANDIYQIAGIADSGNPAEDRAALYLALPQAQELLALENRAHEIVIIAKESKQVRQLAGRLEESFAHRSLAAAPWQVFAKSIYEAMKADQKAGWITIAVIILVVAVGVLNTVLMSVLERRREYGALRALGTSPTGIFRLVMHEVGIMAAAGILIGAGAALLANYILSIHGLSLPEPFHYGGMEFPKMYAEINLRSMLIPAAAVALSASLVAVFPALKASRTPPARAMRTH